MLFYFYDQVNKILSLVGQEFICLAVMVMIIMLLLQSRFFTFSRINGITFDISWANSIKLWYEEKTAEYRKMYITKFIFHNSAH
jgi:hypothetical protein